MSPPSTHAHLAAGFAEIAAEAGGHIMQQYHRDVVVRRKRDETPVTMADHLSEALILERLAALVPGVPVISEEAAAAGEAPEVAAHNRFILVDPLDGTLEFIKRNGEFTVNIALVEAGHPTVGVIYAPASGLMYLGSPALAERLHLQAGHTLSHAIQREAIHCRHVAQEGLVAAVSRSRHDPETDAYLAGLPVQRKLVCGSSLKFCAVAEGTADLYPRFGPTMEWDTAAGDAILAAAGGAVSDQAGRRLRYGKMADGFRNGPFIARAPSAFAVT